MNHSEQFNRLENLLFNYSFESLSSKDKSWVLSEMSEVEYRQQRNLITSSEYLIKEDLGAIPNIESILSRTERVATTKQERTFSFDWRKIFNYPVPVWQAGLGCLIFGFIIFPMFNRPGSAEQIPPALTTIGDTLSKHIIKPLSGQPGGDHSIALGAKVLDSNYHKYSEYIRERKPKELFVEQPLELTPIEYKPKRRKKVPSSNK